MLAWSVVVVVAVALGWGAWPRPPGPTVLHTGTAHYVVVVTAAQPRLGTTDIDIVATPRDSSGALSVEAIRVQGAMPLMGHATEPAIATPTGQGGTDFRVAAVPLMMTGTWELLISIAFSGGAEDLTLPLWVSG
jgi:hypothetical protein